MSSTTIMAFVTWLDMIVSACWRWAASAVIIVLALCAIVMLWPDVSAIKRGGGHHASL